MAKAFRTNTTPKEMHLRRNNIGDDGARALRNALEHNSTLQRMDLDGNNIGDDGARALRNALEHNSTLQRMDLDGNNIGDDGARALRNALEHNSTLQRMDLDGNGISDTLLEEIKQVLAHPRKSVPWPPLRYQAGHRTVLSPSLAAPCPHLWPPASPLSAWEKPSLLSPQTPSLLRTECLQC
eukprot:EG_transcript_25336